MATDRNLMQIDEHPGREGRRPTSKRRDASGQQADPEADGQLELDFDSDLTPEQLAVFA